MADESTATMPPVISDRGGLKPKKNKQQQCPLCPSTLHSIGGLRVHLEHVHQRVITYTKEQLQCPECNHQPFGKRQALVRHMNETHGKPGYEPPFTLVGTNGANGAHVKPEKTRKGGTLKCDQPGCKYKGENAQQLGMHRWFVHKIKGKTRVYNEQRSKRKYTRRNAAAAKSEMLQLMPVRPARQMPNHAPEVQRVAAFCPECGANRGVLQGGKLAVYCRCGINMQVVEASLTFPGHAR